jgi:Fic family protein
MSDKQYFYDQLDEDIKNILLAQIRNVWTHHSTSLEGNSLTLGETDFILEEGLTIQGKPLKDHNEIFGHAKAIERIYGLLSTSENITKQDLFKLHETVLTERVLDIYQPVGKWKVQSNFTNYTDKDNKQQWREYPAPQKTDGLMSQWLARLNNSLTTVQTQDEAACAYADLHLSFVTIHPFFDGNGRMTRLLANLPVLKSGFPPIVVPQEDRYRYKQCLSDYQNTVENLADIGDLAQLPVNIEKQRFVELCKGYWSETIELLDQATAMQQKRLKNLQ